MSNTGYSRHSKGEARTKGKLNATGNDISIVMYREKKGAGKPKIKHARSMQQTNP